MYKNKRFGTSVGMNKIHLLIVFFFLEIEDEAAAPAQVSTSQQTKMEVLRLRQRIFEQIDSESAFDYAQSELDSILVRSLSQRILR